MVTDSSQSIIKLAIVFGCSFLIMDLLYQGRKLAKLYLLLVFYTVQEMAKFTLHSVWSLAIKGCIDSMNELIIAEQIGLDGFYRIIEYLQTCKDVVLCGRISAAYVCCFKMVPEVFGGTC